MSSLGHLKGQIMFGRIPGTVDHCQVVTVSSLSALFLQKVKGLPNCGHVFQIYANGIEDITLEQYYAIAKTHAISDFQHKVEGEQLSRRSMQPCRRKL